MFSAVAAIPTGPIRLFVLGSVALASGLAGAGWSVYSAPFVASAAAELPEVQHVAHSWTLSAESIARADAILRRPLPARTPASAEAGSAVPVAVSPPPDGRTTAPTAELVGGQQRPASAPAPETIRARAIGPEAEFIQQVGVVARRTSGPDSVPASITIAQAIVESDWGRSQLAREHHNYFGIKAFGQHGSAGAVTFPTVEYEGGESIQVQAAFRAYGSLADSVADHQRFLLTNARYRAALAQRHDPAAFAAALQRAGYATDPAYASKLVRLMDRYDLYRYDQR